MANTPINYKEVYDPKLFDPLIKQVKELDSELAKVNEELKEFAKTQAEVAKQTSTDSYKAIEKKTQAIENTRKATEDLDKVEQERIRLQQRLNNLEDERAKTNAELRLRIQERNKELKEQARLSTDAVGAYAKESARLRKLRKEYKDLAIAQGENSDEARALLKEVQELDEKLKDLDKTVGQNQRNVGDYERATKGLKGSLKALAAAGIAGSIAKIGEAFAANEKSALQFQKAIQSVQVFFSVFVSRIVDAGDAIGDLFSGNIFKSQAALERLEKAFSGIGDEVEDLVKANNELLTVENALRKRRNQIVKELARLQKEYETLSVIADDNTLTLEEQAKAASDLADLQLKIADKNVELAAKEFQIANDRAKIFEGNLELQEAAAEAYANLLDAQAQAAAEALEIDKRQREIFRDNIELDLDQLIDIADRRKQINLRIAQDEAVSYEERQEKLNQATNDIDKAYREQARKIQEGLSTAFDIDELLSIEDTTRLNQRIKELGLDEIRQNRLREIILERTAAVDELKEAQQELNNASVERFEIEQAILDQEEVLQSLEQDGVKLNDIILAQEAKILEQRILNLRIRLALAEANSAEALRIEQELNEAIIEQQTNRLEKEQELNDKRKAAAIQTAQDLLNIASDFAQRRAQINQQTIEQELSAAQERESQLREIAAQGNETANENLALEIARREALEREREKALRNQARLELAIAALQTYAAKVGQGDPAALATTTADIGQLFAFLSTLSGFYEGTEYVDPSNTMQFSSGRDGFLARLDSGERVLNAKQNALLPSISNEELVRRVNSPSVQVYQDTMLVQEVRMMREALQNQEIYKGMDFDAKREAITHTMEKKNRIEHKHRNLSITTMRDRK